MSELNCPCEIIAIYFVPRKEADGWARLLGKSNDGTWVPKQMEPVESQVCPDPANGPEAKIKVTYRRRREVGSRGA
jgi:hypothetical protein